MNRGSDGAPEAIDTSQDLDFERADYGEAERADAGSLSCSICEVPISYTYFTRDGSFVCERCEGPAREAGPAGSGFTRLMGAMAAGTFAAVIASALWMVVTNVTGYEIGLIAIAVGWIVGVAIQIGNRGVGGIPYQVMAVFLTYSAIVMTYVPMLVSDLEAQWTEPSSESVADANDLAALEAALETGQADAAENLQMSPEDLELAVWALAIPFAYAVPFLGGFENAIGILIIGFALYQAWSMTVKHRIQWAGPFQVGSA
jgi:hypothetical protein